jgi:hypothetical protein
MPAASRLAQSSYRLAAEFHRIVVDGFGWRNTKASEQYSEALSNVCGDRRNLADPVYGRTCVQPLSSTSTADCIL